MSSDRVDDALRKLVESGELSGLPGEGWPLPVDPDADAREEWAARHLVRSSGARPMWADLREEIAHRRARLVVRLRAHLAWLARREALLARLPAERILAERAATNDADERVHREIGALIDEMNALIRRHNLIVTTLALHLPIVSLERLLHDARAPRP